MISDDVALVIGQHLHAARSVALAELGIFPATPDAIGWLRNMLIRTGRAYFVSVAAEGHHTSAPAADAAIP